MQGGSAPLQALLDYFKHEATSQVRMQPLPGVFSLWQSYTNRSFTEEHVYFKYTKGLFQTIVLLLVVKLFHLKHAIVLPDWHGAESFIETTGPGFKKWNHDHYHFRVFAGQTLFKRCFKHALYLMKLTVLKEKYHIVWWR